MHFCHIFGLSKLLTGGEKGSPKGIAEWKFGSQNDLPDKNLAIKYSYQTVFFCPDNNSLSEILNIFKTNVCPCPWPDYYVLASASGMSLSPQIVHIASQPCTHGP